MRRVLESTGTLLPAVLLAVCAWSGGVSLQAGERVVLTTGFEIHADHHVVEGDRVKIFDGSGVSEVPASLVAEYRVEEYTPPPTPAQSLAAAPQEAIDKLAAGKPLTSQELVRAVVAKHKLPRELVALIESVIKQESGFHANAVSPKGAIGLMQLMPATARQLGADPHDPAQNIEAGTQYLTDLLVKYEDKDDQVARALAAYNAGPGAVDKYKGVPPYHETRDYVRRVVQNYLREQKASDGISQ